MVKGLHKLFLLSLMLVNKKFPLKHLPCTSNLFVIIHLRISFKFDMQLIQFTHLSSCKITTCALSFIHNRKYGHCMHINLTSFKNFLRTLYEKIIHFSLHIFIVSIFFWLYHHYYYLTRENLSMYYILFDAFFFAASAPFSH